MTMFSCPFCLTLKLANRFEFNQFITWLLHSHYMCLGLAHSSLLYAMLHRMIVCFISVSDYSYSLPPKPRTTNQWTASNLCQKYVTRFIVYTAVLCIWTHMQKHKHVHTHTHTHTHTMLLLLSCGHCVGNVASLTSALMVSAGQNWYIYLGFLSVQSLYICVCVCVSVCDCVCSH